MNLLNNDYQPGKLGWHYLDSINPPRRISTRMGFGLTAALCLLALAAAFSGIVLL